MFRSLFAASALCLAATAASMTAATACDAPFSSQDRTYYLGISPSDGPLEVFCRIQANPGEFDVGIQFAETNVYRFTKMKFFGAGRELDGDILRQFIQTLIPTGPGPAIDPVDGMAFSRVLQNVAQGSAIATPDTVKPVFMLSAPPDSSLGQALMMWQHMKLKMSPIKIAGEDFSLTVTFRPSAGRLMNETLYGMRSLIVNGWRERLDLGDYFHKTCSEAIPTCLNLPELVPIHFAMEVAQVTLEANGPDLSNAAEAILKRLDATTSGEKTGTDPSQFDPVRGTAKREIVDPPFALTIEAMAAGGKPKTSQIRVTYEQRMGQNLSYTERLIKQFNEQVKVMTYAASAQRTR